MATRGASLDFVFSNLISGTYSGSKIAFVPQGDSLLLPMGNRVTQYDVVRSESRTFPLEHPRAITNVAMSKCGRYLLTSDRDNNVYVSEKGQKGFLYRKTFKRPVTALAFGPGSVGFAVASANKLRIFRNPGEVSPLKPFIVDKRLGGHFDSITSISFSDNGEFFATCSSDMTIRVFMMNPAKDFSPIVLAGHRGTPVFAKFAEDNRTITSLGSDGTLFVWRITADYQVALVSRRRLDEESFEAPRKNKYQHILAADFNGETLVVGYRNGTFKIYTIPHPESPVDSSFTVTFSTEAVASISLSKNYAALTSATLGEVVIWDLKSNTVAQRTQGHLGGVSCFDYSPNGVVVATGGDDGKLKVWDTQSGSCLMTYAEHQGPVTGIAFSESGRTVITCSYDGTIKAFDIVSGRLFRTFQLPTRAEFTAVAVDKQCQFIAASARGDLSVYLFAVGTGKLLEVLTGHTGPISSLAFSVSNTLVSASWDGTVRVWDFLQTQTSQPFDAQGEATAACVSPDGKILAIANSNGRLIFYGLPDDTYIGDIACAADARGGKRLDSDRMASTSQWYFDTISFSPDGNFLVCGGRTKFICVYSVKARLLMRRFQHTINKEYSGVEKYVKKYHGSGKASNVIQAQFEQRDIIEASSRAVRWCPTGRGMAAATPEGLLVFISADEMVVDPKELDQNVTPASVELSIQKGEYVAAILGAIKLGKTEHELLHKAVLSVPVETINFTALHLPTKYSLDLLQFLGEMLKDEKEVQLCVMWIKAVLRFNTNQLMKDSSSVSVAHLLQKSISSRIEQPKSIARSNLDLLSYLCSQK